jgi:STE24 endopeptidase
MKEFLAQKSGQLFVSSTDLAMRYALLGTFLFLALFALPPFLPSSTAWQRALDQGFTQEDIERGAQYTMQRRLLAWPYVFLKMTLLVVLAFRGRAVAEWCGHCVRHWWLPTVILVGLVCMLILEIVSLPFGLAQLEHLRAWELTERSQLDWFRERMLAFSVFGGIQLLVLAGFYLLLRCFPRTWWLWAGLSTAAIAVAGAFLLPVFISPLFNTFTPVAQTEHADLEPMVQRLFQHAQISVSNILVIDASRQSGHSNAYFTGFGSTRRIVLYDTLLKKQTPAEVETILAHEVGHWKHDHIVKGITLTSIGCLVGNLLLYCFLRWSKDRPPWHLRSSFDPAGVPLLLLLIALGAWVVMPVENIVSRHFERQADLMSLELTGKAEAFIEAKKKLALNNINNLAPNPITVFLFATHPPAVERIQMAKDWRRGRE